jgi:hypothetical protein
MKKSAWLPEFVQMGRQVDFPGKIVAIGGLPEFMVDNGLRIFVSSYKCEGSEILRKSTVFRQKTEIQSSAPTYHNPT